MNSIKRFYKKYSALKKHLESLDAVAIAFSGGVDSTFLAKAAVDVLGKRALAITIDSEAYPPESIQVTRDLAAHMGIRLIELQARACDIPGFRANEPDRCYHCKKELFTLMLNRACQEGITVLMDGSNADDIDDYRPGERALAELGVRSPLRELGFAKPEIREISRELGLPTWNRQSFACLASRVPYGSEITPERLEKIWKAESLLRELDIKHYRVRDHGTIARIELDEDGMALVMKPENRRRVIDHMKSCGFTYITLDLQGFRTGSMNEPLNLPPQ